jgi:D-alanyl-D-alanine carboxypeptidase (penicillin-binding protein 5/6)
VFPFVFALCFVSWWPSALSAEDKKAVTPPNLTLPVLRLRYKIQSGVAFQPPIKAVSAILVDAESGQVLFAKNADLRRPIASTTKIMTALLLSENVDQKTVITASKNAARTPESSLHLKPGEKLTAHDLMRAVLMRSANDACVAVAEHIAGSEAAFATRMNQRAVELGATNTNFVNSHGLHHKRHYSTARDLALIARAAMRDPRIREVTCLKTCAIARSSGSKDTLLRNHSRFLSTFPGADGIKTGWTIPAGKCYIGSVTLNGWQLISVVLKSPDYVADTQALMTYGYSLFHPQIIRQQGEIVGPCPITNGETDSVPAATRYRARVVLRADNTLPIEQSIHYLPISAPIHVGDAVGSLELRQNGTLLSTVPLIATLSIAAQNASTTVRLQGGSLRSLALATTILATGLVSLRYGTRYRIRFATLAQSARRRWRRFQKSLRSPHRSG